MMTTECPHGYERSLPGRQGLCPSCDTDREDMPLDRCPCCSRIGTWGIRSHPKFAVKVGTRINGELDMVAFYAHELDHATALADTFRNDGFSEVIAVEHWDGRQWADTGY